MTKQEVVATTPRLCGEPLGERMELGGGAGPETPAGRRDTHWPGHKNEPLASVGRPSGFTQILSL